MILRAKIITKNYINHTISFGYLSKNFHERHLLKNIYKIDLKYHEPQQYWIYKELTSVIKKVNSHKLISIIKMISTRPIYNQLCAFAKMI